MTTADAHAGSAATGVTAEAGTDRGRLHGKRAIVTGASSGIGEGIARAFATAGAEVAVFGRDRARTESVAADINSSGGRAFAVLADVSDEPVVRSAVSTAVERLGGVDILVNSAGIGELDGWVPVHETELDSWLKTLRVNLLGPYMMSRAVLPVMKEHGSGAILHISSVCAITVWAGDSAYGVSKAALNMLSDHIAVEYAKYGIRSNTLMPAEILTPLHDSAVAAADDPAEHNRAVLSRHPIGRFGTVQEVAGAALFLCSDESGFLTGANVPIDGAYSRI
jgi:NAD(P)-dependent dehydrogenase (short-subunit alcohol dehydrogenase family)